jgi:lysyl-tRNA synthetase class 1
VVPDPFGGDDAPSFGHHNNAMLRRFLDTFGFDYEFASATDYYRRGSSTMPAARRRALRRDHGHHAADAGRGTPARPIRPSCRSHPETGRVLYVPMKEVDAKDGTVTFDDEDGANDAGCAAAT